ncbi:hypothetical protein LTR37_000179 [Vermiconidia calcicola]|uniref:Uncharacterized protein n=1 Tax=Vermiconidia calcicola TaxID=1690605 RepID=A0ACC3NZN7_9PEZI|nr:hypothetical protein LTR37_000179 [Vermiconidia calcicola]
MSRLLHKFVKRQDDPRLASLVKLIAFIRIVTLPLQIILMGLAAKAVGDLSYHFADHQVGGFAACLLALTVIALSWNLMSMVLMIATPPTWIYPALLIDTILACIAVYLSYVLAGMVAYNTCGADYWYGLYNYVPVSNSGPNFLNWTRGSRMHCAEGMTMFILMCLAVDTCFGFGMILFSVVVYLKFSLRHEQGRKSAAY